MMAHPSPGDCLYPPFLCSTKVQVSYHGRNAHAAAAPWEGVNALDAVLQAFSNISMMRQQVRHPHLILTCLVLTSSSPNPHLSLRSAHPNGKLMAS